MHLLFVFIYLILSVFSTEALSFENRVSPSDPLIRYTGRIDRRNPENIRFDWPGISIEMLFEGTFCTVEMKGAGESFNVFVDGNLIQFLKTDSLVHKYKLVSGIKDTVHRLLLTKRFEHKGDITELRGFYLDSAKYLKLLPERPPYRIEFIGASTLSGFGNESGTLHCDSIKLLDSSNCYFSYGPIASRVLNAECMVIAMSSKGLTRNWGLPFVSWYDAFSEYYSRTLQNEPEPLWNRKNWIPHVVVINLGANDFSSKPKPPRVLFENAYHSLLQSIYSEYPDVEIVCLTSETEPLRSIVSSLVENEIANGNDRIHFLSYDLIPTFERGCDWHPNVSAHKKIAKKLISVINPILQRKQIRAGITYGN